LVIYKIINFRGFVPVVGYLVPKSLLESFFFSFGWLLRALTRDNLAKRRKVEDENCLFCLEKETIQHVFFDCVVARWCWDLM